MSSQRQTALPGFYFGKTFAPSPVWKGGTMNARFIPIGDTPAASRKAAAKLYHKAREFERRTRGRVVRKDGKISKQDGAIGRTGLAVLHAFLFDFLNHKTGQLDPAYETIAAAASCSVRTVARALVRLKEAGVISWERQLEGAVVAGRYCLRQLSNAYAVLRTTSWRGFVDRPPAPPPEPGTWGDHPPIVAGLEAAAEAIRAGAKGANTIAPAESDPGDALGNAIGRLGRFVFRNP